MSVLTNTEVVEAMAERALDVVRAASPLDFPQSLPMYAVATSRMGYHGPTGVKALGLGCYDLAGGWLAATGLRMDQYVKPILQEQGKWRGLGFATILNDRETLILSQVSQADYPALLGAVLHEGAHHIQFHAGEPAGGHGLLFTRCVLHLWSRAQSVSPFDVQHIGGVEHYGLSSWNNYLMAFAGEIQGRRHEAIQTILTSAMPENARSLYNTDQANAARRRNQNAY